MGRGEPDPDGWQPLRAYACAGAPRCAPLLSAPPRDDLGVDSLALRRSGGAPRPAAHRHRLARARAGRPGNHRHATGRHIVLRLVRLAAMVRAPGYAPHGAPGARLRARAGDGAGEVATATRWRIASLGAYVVPAVLGLVGAGVVIWGMYRFHVSW